MKLETLGPSARVVMFKDGTRVLISYETPVAAYVAGEYEQAPYYVKTAQFHSRTTSQHVSKFLNGRAARIVPQEALTAIMESR